MSGQAARLGFTLAEVLITLGIIGVVAALTMPSLIANYKNKVYVNQLKKAYSVISQGIQKMYVDNGCVDWSCMALSDTQINDKDFMISLFSKSFNIVQTDTKGGKLDYVNKLYSPEKDDAVTSIEYLFSFILEDGSTWYYLGTMMYSNELGFYVDINGKGKGPNKSGRDIFVLTLSSKGVIVPTLSRQHWEAVCSSPVSNHECTPKEMADAYEPAMYVDCSKNGAQSITSMSCLFRIIKDNWEMNY